MSDLNDFFAKKDRRKKKPAKSSKSGQSDGAKDTSSFAEKGISGVSQSGSALSGTKHTKADDGWIELDEATTAKVNTGGRTVEDFKRDVDDRDTNGDAESPAEKFSGWSKADAEEAQKSQDVGAVPSSMFPTLADAADAPEVPQTKGTERAQVHGSRPRRFINSKVDALKKLLEDRNN